MDSRVRLSRRSVLKLFGLAPLVAACDLGGASPGGGERPDDDAPDVIVHEPPPVDVDHPDNLQAAMDLILPAERDATGALVSPGAVEARAMDVLRLADLLPLTTSLGLLPPRVVDALPPGDTSLALAIDATLNALAAEERPFTEFRELPRDLRERALVRGFDDDATEPLLTVLRAACMLAFLGAVTNDVGLVAIGFPPFEDPAHGVVVSGYPRLVGAAAPLDLATTDRADLVAWAAAGQLDDYTFDRAPDPTPGDDLAAVLDAHGDLL
ncbi:MAG: hypothetical protein H6745_29235 [Deltaproteobacteria bacterium]|nr:hypothetical protein [Deltaproteobacteria bacterium]